MSPGRRGRHNGWGQDQAGHSRHLRIIDKSDITGASRSAGDRIAKDRTRTSP